LFIYIKLAFHYSEALFNEKIEENLKHKVCNEKIKIKYIIIYILSLPQILLFGIEQ